jgi:hypothetical protein
MKGCGNRELLYGKETAALHHRKIREKQKLPQGWMVPENPWNGLSHSHFGHLPLLGLVTYSKSSRSDEAGSGSTT